MSPDAPTVWSLAAIGRVASPVTERTDAGWGQVPARVVLEPACRAEAPRVPEWVDRLMQDDF